MVFGLTRGLAMFYSYAKFTSCSDSDEDDERKNSKLWRTRHTTFFFPGAGQLFIGKHFLDGDIVQNGD